MIHPLHFPRRARLRLSALALVAGLLPTACKDSDPVSSAAPSDLPVAADTAAGGDSPDTAGADSLDIAGADSLVPSLATSGYSGLPYGPIGLWSSSTSVYWGPSPFTGSQNHTDPGGIITQIKAARSKHQRLLLAMTGGPSTRYTTNGKFDMAKWKNRMNAYKTSAIRSAVAAAVADGTIIGNQLIDEPETPRWGGNISKATIDRMASYAKGIFPTLPVGVNHGPPAYRWRSTERYQVLDYVIYQYNWYVTGGNITSWRDAVVNRARVDGVTPAFSLNVLDGGVQDRKGSWDCSGTGGKGTYYPNCRMTADQVRNWGRVIGVAGCAMQMWRYDGKFVSNSANQRAFRDVAATLASRPRRSCRRP